MARMVLARTGQRTKDRLASWLLSADLVPDPLVGVEVEGAMMAWELGTSTNVAPALTWVDPLTCGGMTGGTFGGGLGGTGLLADVCEVPAPEAAACVVFGSAGTDFGSDSIPFDVDLPALAFEALASTCERGVNTIGVCPRSSVGRQGAPAVEALAVDADPGVALGAADRDRSTRGGAAEDEAFESELNTVLGGATLVSAERTWRRGTKG